MYREVTSTLPSIRLHFEGLFKQPAQTAGTPPNRPDTEVALHDFSRKTVRDISPTSCLLRITCPFAAFTCVPCFGVAKVFQQSWPVSIPVPGPLTHALPPNSHLPPIPSTEEIL
jgi:hypothetical protein